MDETQPEHLEQEATPEGMSAGARWTLAVFMLLFTVFCFSMVETGQAPKGLRAVGVFCAMIAIVCLAPPGRIRGLAARGIGATVFGLGVAYAISTALDGQWFGARSDSTFFNALMFLVVFGLPGLYVAVTGRYPGWGTQAEAFGANEEDR